MPLSTDPDGQPVTLDLTGETSPYPFFEYMRRTDPVWHGGLADHSQMPEELRPSDEWVLFGHDALFRAFRDDRIFSSHKYDETIIAFLRLLLPAGLETTYRSSGNLLYLLLTHPEQLAMLCQDRSLIPAAIEEGLRFETPLTMVTRTTTEEVEIGGKTIPPDAQIDMCMGSANRDESRWADADAFDIRRPRQAHVAFAGGIHMCLGMHLARLETRVMLNSLFDRVKDLTLVPDDGTGEESKIVELTFRSPNKLPVTFAPAA